jgi:hypothetical protein
MFLQSFVTTFLAFVKYLNIVVNSSKNKRLTLNDADLERNERTIIISY